MNWNFLSEKFQAWVAEFREAAALSNDEVMASGREEWFAGLAVSPAEFSNQMADLQVSLERASVPKPQMASADAARETVSHQA